MPFFILGNGSNLLVADEGYRGIVLSLSKMDDSLYLENETTICCNAGAMLAKVCVFAMKNNLSGLEFAWGIPGMLMIILLIFMIIRISRKYTPQHRLMNYIPLIILLFKSMAGQLLTSGYTMLALAYAYLCLAQGFEVKNANPTLSVYLQSNTQEETIV